MGKIRIPIAGGSYTHKVVPFDAQETINMYPERGGKGSKAPSILLRFPGLLASFTLATGTGGIRGKGLYETSGHRFFAVRGNSLVELFADGTQTVRGTLNSLSGPVSMVDNGADMAIADGTNIYQYTLATDTLTVVTDADAPDTTPVVDYIDGYIFGFDPDAASLGEFQHCNLLDVSDWLGTDKYNAESNPDSLVSLIVNNDKLMLLGSKSYEWWYNTGATTRTWAKLPGASRSIGCAATHSVAKMGGRVFWLGASKEGRAIVYMSEGLGAIEISTKPLESWINNLAVTDDAIGFTLQHNGHFWYILSFQTGDRTYAFDLSVGEWFRIAYRDTYTGDQGRHRILAAAFFDDKNYVGDYALGVVHELSDTTYTDNGDPQVCERYFTHFEMEKELLFWESIEIDVETGVGLLGSGWGSDPYIELRWSDDGGKTWSNFRQIKIGKIGQYYKRAKEWRLGSSRTRTYHLRYSDPTPFSLPDKAIAEVSRGDF